MRTALTLVFILCSAGAAQAAPADAAEVTFLFNTLLFLIGGFLVMFMSAGFAMLEAGLVRTMSVATILTKNISLFAVAAIVFYLFGYNLMYRDVMASGGFWGIPGPWQPDDGNALATGHAASADWFFQMVFVATTTSIVSGTIAERVKLWAFLLFAVAMSGFIYPVVGSWHWGKGWLAERGFFDFAGTAMVHTVGGIAALTGALIAGPRHGRFDAKGRPSLMLGSSMPLATIGTFILWLGWFGFNGASQLAFGTIKDAIAVSTIFVNTNMAAAAGVVTAMILTQLIYKKVDLSMALNGALAGLVAITADPLSPSILQAMFVGAVGAGIVVAVVPLLLKVKIDDVVGAIPVHLCCGIWGTLIVPLTNESASFLTQATGLLAIAIFVGATSSIVWLALKAMKILTLSPEEQQEGADFVELGMEAYPEFVMRHSR